MSETDSNYSGQSTRPVEDSRPKIEREIDRSGTRPRPHWLRYASGDEVVIVPIDLSDDPEKIAALMAKKGLGPENLGRIGKGFDAKFYADNDDTWPNNDK